MDDIHNPTKITLETYGKTYTWKVPYSDVNGNEIVEGLAALMIAASWSPVGVLGSLQGAYEHLREQLTYFSEKQFPSFDDFPVEEEEFND